MQNKIDLDNQSFFGKGVEFWLGKIVKFSDQKSQTSGNGWGWRYKVYDIDRGVNPHMYWADGVNKIKKEEIG